MGHTPDPCITFPAKHSQVGDIQIFDDGDEITLVAGHFTHGHFSNYEDIADIEKAKKISEDVADFLNKVFSDQVVFWGSHKHGGGWRTLDSVNTYQRKHPEEYVWSGPKNDN